MPEELNKVHEYVYGWESDSLFPLDLRIDGRHVGSITADEILDSDGVTIAEYQYLGECCIWISTDRFVSAIGPDGVEFQLASAP